MADHHGEQEQIEALKRWWQDNRNHVVAGLVLGVAIVGGWRFWQAYQTRKAEEGSALHAQVLEAASVKDTELADALFARLQSDYAMTPYAAQGALVVAKLAVEADDLAKARAALEWAATHAADAELVTVIKLRLARVQLAQGEAETALKTLGGLTAGKFAALVEELRGDAQFALGRQVEARAAWTAALAAVTDGVGDRALLQMKLDDLAPAPEVVK